MRKTIAAALVALLASASSQVLAQDSEGSSAGLPGSVFSVPAGGDTPVSSEVDPEVTTDMHLFRQRGFSEPDWQTHTAHVEDVLRDVVLPDWRRRTSSEKDPMLPSIDVAAANVLGGDYNDLLVMSRLPGDCDETGCLFQLYSFVNDVWVKRFEFKTVTFAWKRKDDGTPLIGKVGGMWVPSQTLVWADGKLR